MWKNDLVCRNNEKNYMQNQIRQNGSNSVMLRTGLHESVAKVREPFQMRLLQNLNFNIA